MSDRPVIRVSSLDGAPVPFVRNAVALERLAREHGWTAWQTYAYADAPERYWKNGRIRKRAHRMESVAVRMRRGGLGVGEIAWEIAWGIWHRTNEGPWEFASAAGTGRGTLTLGQLEELVAA